MIKRGENLAGRRFGRLTIIELVRSDHIGRTWRARCDCGVEKLLGTSNLARTRSCGCLAVENGRARATHGESRTGAQTPEYRTWVGMIGRCTYPTHSSYRWYGAIGISVCQRWLKYENFLADMGRKPSPKHSIDRRDPQGNYEPENCRWATPVEQANNHRNTRFLTHDGLTMSVTEWERHVAFPIGVIRQRLDVLGWTVADAITRPLRGT